jgi:hypothetical protein
VRSFVGRPALPALDIAKRRDREASRLTIAGVAAILPGLWVVVLKLDAAAGAAVLTGAVAFGFIGAEGLAGALAAFDINAALPVVDSALRLSRLNSLAVFVVAGCAMLTPCFMITKSHLL